MPKYNEIKTTESETTMALTKKLFISLYFGIINYPFFLYLIRKNCTPSLTSVNVNHVKFD